MLLFKPKLLYRKRVKKMFEYIFERPLFLIVASTGYGKTTSIRRFLNTKKNVEQIWFSLNSNETDIIWIWNKLCSIIYKTYPELSKKLSNYGLPQNNIDIQYFINALKDCINKPTVLIFDDYQEINNQIIDKFIENIAYAKIPNLHMVIISRVYPDFPYNELILKGYCYIAEQKMIAFTLSETKDFFALNNFKLTDEELMTLFDYTEGWISAMYLAILCYEKDRNFNNLNDFHELIKTTVYDKFDDGTKEIIMKLSPLDNFTLNQAVAVTNNKAAISTIRKLNFNSCFIKYDPKNEIYILHTILREVAKQYLENSNIDINEIFKLSAKWCFENKQYISAIEFYYKCSEFENIFYIIEENLDYELFTKAPIIIVNAFNKMSIEQKLSHPLAYILFIKFYIFNINEDKGIEMLYYAKEMYTIDINIENKNEILGEIALIERIINYNDINKMNKYLDKAYNLFNGKTSKISNSNTIFNFASPNNLLIFHTRLCNLNYIVEITEENFWKYNKITNNCGAGYEYLIKAEYLYETGELEKAELLAYKARFKARTQNQLSLVCSATFLLMRIAIINGKKEDLNDYINELCQHILIAGKMYLITQMDIMLGYIYSCILQIEKIPSWLNNYDTEVFDLVVNNMNVSIVTGKIIIAKKDFIKLEEFSYKMLELFKKGNHIFGIIISKIYLSIAKYNLYGLNEALPYILSAIEYARYDNIYMPFAENVIELLPILYNVDDEYVKKILPFCEKANNSIKKLISKNLVNLLTERELEVMDLVCKGYKNTEIAEIISIALVTVEKMLSNIYKKLEVKNRIAAVAVIKSS